MSRTVYFFKMDELVLWSKTMDLQSTVYNYYFETISHNLLFIIVH